MSKGLVFGLIAGAAAVTAAAAIYFKKKNNDLCCCDDDDFDENELDCEYCSDDDCCNCDEKCTEIPAEKAEDSGVIVTDTVVAFGNTAEEALDSLDSKNTTETDTEKN